MSIGRKLCDNRRKVLISTPCISSRLLNKSPLDTGMATTVLGQIRSAVAGAERQTIKSITDCQSCTKSYHALKVNSSTSLHRPTISGCQYAQSRLFHTLRKTAVFGVSHTSKDHLISHIRHRSDGKELSSLFKPIDFKPHSNPDDINVGAELTGTIRKGLFRHFNSYFLVSHSGMIILKYILCYQLPCSK